MQEAWFELRVAGSAGTRAGNARGARVGVAISENGRLCPVGSDSAKRFASEREAIEYLENTTNPPMYEFEAVRCGAATAATRYAPEGGSPSAAAASTVSTSPGASGLK